ncbi:MAG TPA: hypothetical protein VMZ06_04255 [Candidatus Bathyarchaeia archaeon]|nr:hypothetical protein [Candidatus Bathyarchaeia archaeon]
MIDINLLPWHLRPIKRSPVPYVASLLAAGLVLLALAGMSVDKQRQIGEQRAILKDSTEKLQTLQDIVDEFERLETQKVELAEKVSIINEILADRIIWSRQLWNVSRLTPDNFWFSSIAVKEKQFTETRKEMNPQTKKEEIKKITVRRPILELTGYVIEGADGTSDINPLTYNMQDDQEFSGIFQLDLPKFQDTLFESYKVRGFTLEYLINQGGRGA